MCCIKAVAAEVVYETVGRIILRSGDDEAHAIELLRKHDINVV